MTTNARVGVTRPAGRGRSLAAALEAHGLEPVMIPLIETRVVADLDPVRSVLLGGPSLLVLSSATSVPALAASGGAPEGVVVAAVGPATAEALADVGSPASIIGDGSGGAALVERIGRPPSPGDRAVVLAAAGGRREVVDGLAAQGWSVDEVVVYETLPRRIDEAEIAELDGCSVVCFASPSAVEAFVALRDARGERLRPHRAVAIGETTADAARHHGLDVVLAASATDEAMAVAAAGAVDGAHGS
jgi:uroporphyrinogen-III synthase